jgi:tRNA nucleotidyltransferase (CCA-adding enzyme)
MEVEQRHLPSTKKHLGPPVEREKECENFLSKYANNGTVVAGPYIESGRWMVELRRKHTDVVELLREKLESGGKDAGVAGLISKAFQKKLEILVNTEVAKPYQGNREFAEFLTDFFKGKPFWLESTAATASPNDTS